MREFLEGIFEFSKTAMSDNFVKEEKQVSNKLQNILSQVYQNDGDEIELVEKTIDTLNSSRSSYFKLESMFIHGNRSQIKFQYYGKIAQKELGDLLFVSTLTRRGTPLLQKLTIIQAKRDTIKPCTWGIDKEQLYFLSNWPKFSGVIGIFPSKDITIPDYSSCLGSYYLYRDPGDFVFISTKELDNLMGSKKRIVFDDLLKSRSEITKHNNFGFPFSPALPFHPEDMLYIYEKYFHHWYKLGFPPIFPNYAGNTLQILQNICFCKNLDDAIGNFARLNVGEPIFTKDSIIPVNEFGYRMLNTIIRYISRNEQGRLGQLMEFNGDAPFFEEINMKGIRVGIIHTITEVSPG